MSASVNLPLHHKVVVLLLVVFATNNSHVVLCPLAPSPSDATVAVTTALQPVATCRQSPYLGMRGIPISEKYCGINSDGITYRGLAKYRGIPSGGTDFQ